MALFWNLAAEVMKYEPYSYADNLYINKLKKEKSMIISIDMEKAMTKSKTHF